MINRVFLNELQHLSGSTSYRKRLQVVTATRFRSSNSHVELASLIGAVLLIEMHQRPGVVRAAEWACSLLIPRILRRPITRGPLQIAEGPWDMREAINVAVQVLGSAVEDARSQREALRCAAVAWNGAASRQPGARYGYAEVLAYAYQISMSAIHQAMLTARTSGSRTA